MGVHLRIISFLTNRNVLNRTRSKKSPGYTFAGADLLAISQEIAKHHSPRRHPTPTALVVLPVDPYHLHAAWNISNCVLDSQLLTNKPRLNTFTLRIFHTLEGWFDIEVEGLKNQRRVNVPLDDSHYFAEIGLSDIEGRFNTLLRSSSIHVPRNAPAQETSERFQVAPSIDGSTHSTLSEEKPATAEKPAYPDSLSRDAWICKSAHRQLDSRLPPFPAELCNNPLPTRQFNRLTHSGIGC